MNVNGITHSIEDVIKYLNKLQHNSKISNHGNKLPLVSKIKGNGPSKFFDNFKFTKLEKGLKNTIDFYKKIDGKLEDNALDQISLCKTTNMDVELYNLICYKNQHEKTCNL